MLSGITGPALAGMKNWNRIINQRTAWINAAGPFYILLFFRKNIA
jgi:hypothetical protein